jgi:hypothetical protein
MDFFCFHSYDIDKNKTNDTLFIGIVRNPIYWLNSFSKELYHIPDVNKKNLSNFLFNEFYSVTDELYNNNTLNHFNTKRKPELNLNDLNYLTRNKYKNIFEMRYLKNHYLMNIIPQKVNNYILINYEDLLHNYDTTLQTIKNKYLLTQTTNSFLKIAKYKKSDSYQFVKQREITFTPPIIQLIWQNLNIEQEKKLGYIPFDNNNIFINNNITTNKNDCNNYTNNPLSDG